MRCLLGAAGLAALLAASPALAQQPKVLRIAMTAADVPTTTGMPNNGFEGMRFLGYPAFEGLVLWDLSRADATDRIGETLFVSWMLLLGGLPVERAQLRIVELGPGMRFVEQSKMWMLSSWRHERIVMPVEDGARVTDTGVRRL